MSDNKYIAEIAAWNWDAIRSDAERSLFWDADNNDCQGRSWLGTVQHLYPSGKIYAPWTANQTDDDVANDEAFGEALESVADAHGLYIDYNDGEIVACLRVDPSDVDDNKHDFFNAEERDAFTDACLAK